MYSMISFEISIVERDVLLVEKVLLLVERVLPSFFVVCKLLKYNMVDTTCLGNIIIQRITVQRNLPT